MKNKYFSFYQFPIIVFLISWFHYFNTKSLKVDQNPVNPFYLNIFLFTLLVISFYYYIKLIKSNLDKYETLSLDYLYKYSINVLLISVVTLPILSNDVFSVFSYSYSYLNGVDIYNLNYKAVKSVYTEMSNPTYVNLPCKYGPISMLVSNVSVYFAQQNVILALIFYKFFFFVFGSIFIFYANKFDYQNRNYIILLIPIWWFQGIGQLHNDLFGVLFILIALFYYYKKDSIFITSIFIVLAMLTKLTFVLFAIFPILDMFINKKWNFFLKYVLYLVLFSLLLGYIFYYPFIRTITDVLIPLKSMNTERPSSTFTDIFAHIGLIFNQDFKSNYVVLIPIFKVLGLFTMALFSLYYLLKYYKSNANEKLILFLFLALIFIFSHRFLPWYFMIVPLFLFFTKDNEWIKWILIIFFVSTFQDFAIFINTNNLIGQITMVISTAFTVSLFFYKLKKRL